MKTKKLAQLVLTLMLTVFLTFGGATLAMFSGSAQNSGNVAHAGTIDLTAKRDHGDYVPGPMFYPDSLDPAGNHSYDKSEIQPSGESPGGWAPGDTVTRTMILVNNGSLDAKVTGIKATPRDSYTQELPDHTSRTATGFISGAAYDEFIQKANVTVSVPDQSLTLYDGPLSGLIVTGDAYAPVNNELVLQGTLPPFQPGPLNISFEVHLDNSATNEVQGKSFIFDFGFYAEQVRNNGDQNAPSDTVSGTVSDAVSGSPLSGAVLSFRSGPNSQTGNIIATATSQSNGSYTVNLPVGNYTAEVSHQGYITTYMNIVSVANQTTPDQNISLSPVLNAGETRVVLTWSASPYDLDSHLTGPNSDGSRFHLFYANPVAYDGNGQAIATLDNDVTSGFGPETVTTTINAPAQGTYRYFVHDYSNQYNSASTDLANSSATVRVYRNNALVNTFTVPNAAGTVWHVFSIVDGAVVINNTIDTTHDN